MIFSSQNIISVSLPPPCTTPSSHSINLQISQSAFSFTHKSHLHPLSHTSHPGISPIPLPPFSSQIFGFEGRYHRIAANSIGLQKQDDKGRRQNREGGGSSEPRSIKTSINKIAHRGGGSFLTSGGLLFMPINSRTTI